MRIWFRVRVAPQNGQTPSTDSDDDMRFGATERVTVFRDSINLCGWKGDKRQPIGVKVKVAFPRDPPHEYPDKRPGYPVVAEHVVESTPLADIYAALRADQVNAYTEESRRQRGG